MIENIMVIVKTKYGKIKGNQEDNLQSFLGIPYAKPPIGNLRFRKPLSLDNWDEIKDASKFGPIAHQNHKDTPPIDQIESEDCLYLNIWTPKADEPFYYDAGFKIRVKK